MKNLKNVLNALANIKGTQFINIKGYCNANGEISDQLILVGADYNTMRLKDIETLEAMVAENDIERLALAELIDSMKKNTSDETRTNQSQAQLDAYFDVCKGVKLCKETGDLHIKGTLINKTVHIKGTYKEVKSSAKTLAKKKFQKDLRTSKYKTFKIQNIGELKVNGETIEVSIGE